MIFRLPGYTNPYDSRFRRVAIRPDDYRSRDYASMPPLYIEAEACPTVIAEIIAQMTEANIGPREYQVLTTHHSELLIETDSDRAATFVRLRFDGQVIRESDFR